MDLDLSSGRVARIECWEMRTRRPGRRMLKGEKAGRRRCWRMRRKGMMLKHEREMR